MLSHLKDWMKILGKDELTEAQNELLKHNIPFLGSHDQLGRVAKVGKAYIDDTNWLNEFSITNCGEGAVEPDNLLMIHGYGAGLGLFTRNYDGLTTVESNKKFNLFSIDLLGHSLSSFPKFPFEDNNFKSPKIKINFNEKNQKSVNSKVAAKDQDETKILEDEVNVVVKDEKNVKSVDYEDSQKDLLKIADTTLKTVRNYESYYVESIEKWRKKKNLEKINLLGHSFGAYLSLCYTIKYPENVEKLILVSPVGVERSVFAVNSMKYHADSNILKNIIPSKDQFSYDHIGRLVQMPGFIMRLWDSTYFPFSILRGIGPFGVLAASRYTKVRYNQGSTSEEELHLLSNYVMATFWKKSSTEKAISRILSPVVAARDPIIDKLEDFHKSGKKLPPSLWIYGEKDWMDVKAGKRTTELINREDRGGEARFEIVNNSGHNLFLDNPKDFNKLIKNYLGWH